MKTILKKPSKILNAPIHILNAYGKIYKGYKQQNITAVTGSARNIKDSNSVGIRE